MVKLKIIYICEQCQATISKWSGQCPKCGAWNSLVEDVIDDRSVKIKMDSIPRVDLTKFSSSIKEESRISSQISELDRVMGGGMVRDNFILLTGDPGVGKSTLALQIAKQISSQDYKTIYFSGEESLGQIVSRANRIEVKNNANLFIVNETILERIIATIKSEKPQCCVIDSAQVVYSPELPSMPGAINQVKLVAENLMRIAKEEGIIVILIGHVTKDGNLAGPMFLSHLVDTVLFLEGEGQEDLRILRANKNRFGPTTEIGLFRMQVEGLVEINNPSESFLASRQTKAIGSTITAICEGSRTFLLETQALTTYTKFGYPKRTSSGYDMNRLNIMIAVLNKYADMKLDSQDVFVNIVGGLKVRERAVDLGLCLAIASSKFKKLLANDLLIIGEVGLCGEIRNVVNLEKRIKEGQRLGFSQIMVPAQFKKNMDNLIKVSTIKEAVAMTLA